jgi:exopolyphosphatase/guanosine-5'-triphosphate,3'-diphosphate pyrophosphatase
VPTSVSAGSPVGASVDLGSNSVHLLVAAIEGPELRPLVDESVFLGLGAAVDERAHLGPTARAELAATIARYAATARTHGATAVTLLGTEPIRRAADAARIVAEVAATSGDTLHVLSHAEEAYLTLVGGTGGAPVRDETLVVDIGGGSSEFGAVSAGGLARAAGLRLGSNRLTTRFARTDPITATAFAAMSAAADEILRSALPAEPSDLVIVGGTASNLLKVTAAGVADRVLTRDRLREAAEHLLAEPAERLTTRFAVNPKRSPLLPAGAAIVEALMRHYDVDQVRVSDAGLREGAILAVGHAGRAWRDRLPALAHGWRS